MLATTIQKWVEKHTTHIINAKFHFGLNPIFINFVMAFKSTFSLFVSLLFLLTKINFGSYF